VQNVLGRLLIIAEATEREVGQRVAAAVVGPGVEDGQPVRFIVARLVVDEGVPWVGWRAFEKKV
jgi:hypothetical protein